MPHIDLSNVLPISKASSSLAALLRRAKATGADIIVTQKGYPTGVIMSVERYAELTREPLPFEPEGQGDA